MNNTLQALQAHGLGQRDDLQSVLRIRTPLVIAELDKKFKRTYRSVLVGCRFNQREKPDLLLKEEPFKDLRSDFMLAQSKNSGFQLLK